VIAVRLHVPRTGPVTSEYYSSCMGVRAAKYSFRQIRMFVGRHGPDVQARGSASFVPPWLSGRRNHSWPAGSACLLTAGPGVLGDRRILLPGPAAWWVCTGSVAGAWFGSRKAQARGAWIASRAPGEAVGQGADRGGGPTWIWAARCSAPEPSGDDRTCVPQSGSYLQMEGLQAEDRHNPLPHIALSTTAPKSVYEKTVSLAADPAPELG
jgi:hypothetical protein